MALRSIPFHTSDMKKKASDPDNKIVASNRKARHDFEILDTMEVGLVLHGSEVKSLREGGATLKDSYAHIDGNEMWLHNLHIAPYQYAREGHEPERKRKLLAHRREIDRLIGKINEQGLTLIPLSIYFHNGYAKVDLAVARGRRSIDKRHAIKEREQKREMERGSRRRS